MRTITQVKGETEWLVRALPSFHITCAMGASVSSFGLQRAPGDPMGLPWEPSAWCPGPPLEFIRVD